MCLTIAAASWVLGGKLCIDGTKKFEEETDDRSVLTLRSFDGLRAGMALGDMRELTASQFTNAFPEIKSVNVSLLKKRNTLPYCFGGKAAAGSCKGTAPGIGDFHCRDGSDKNDPVRRAYGRCQ